MYGCTAKLSCWPQQHTSGSKPIREALHTMSTSTNSLRVHRPFETVGAARSRTGTDVEGQPEEASLGALGKQPQTGGPPSTKHTRRHAVFCKKGVKSWLARALLQRVTPC